MCLIACKADRPMPAPTIRKSMRGWWRSRRGKFVVSTLFVAALMAPVIAGAATHGGAVSGGAVIHVTTLADAGPGSLRAGVQPPGPKVIVFDFGGVIHLATDLKVSIPQTTIAGQTAPAPVTLTGGSLR